MMILTLIRRWVFISVMLYFIYVIIYFSFKKESPLERDIISPSLPSRALSSSIQRKKKDYSLFLQEIKNKSIFTSPYLEERSTSSEVDLKKVKEIIENLKLRGIIYKAPKRAIIEDKMTGRSFYLKEGEVFLENIQIEKIENDSVILNAYGEKFELYL